MYLVFTTTDNKSGCFQLNFRVTYSQDKLQDILIGRKEDLAKIATPPPLPVNMSNLSRECESNKT